VKEKITDNEASTTGNRRDKQISRNIESEVVQWGTGQAQYLANV